MKSHYLFFTASGLKHNDQVFEGPLFDYLRYFLKNVAVRKINKPKELDQQSSAAFLPQGGNLVANTVNNNNRKPLVLFTALAMFPVINAEENYFFYGNGTSYQFTTTPYCPDVVDKMLNAFVNKCNVTLVANLTGFYTSFADCTYCLRDLGGDDGFVREDALLLHETSELLDLEMEQCLLGILNHYEVDTANFFEIIGIITAICAAIMLLYLCCASSNEIASYFKNLYQQLKLYLVGLPPTYQEQITALEEKHNIQINIPAHLCSPGTHQLMDDPITVNTGLTFDRTALKQFFTESGNPEEIVTPYDPLPISADACEFATNVLINAEIEDFIEKVKANPHDYMHDVYHLHIDGPIQQVNRSFAQRIARVAENFIIPATPEKYLCPFSKEEMDVPITISSGITYDQTQLAQWAVLNGAPEYMSCAVTRILFKTSQINEFGADKIVRALLEDYVQAVERGAESGIFPVRPPPPEEEKKQAEVVELNEEVPLNSGGMAHCLQPVRRYVGGFFRSFSYSQLSSVELQERGEPVQRASI